jgi:hypothetical protein
VPAQSVCRIANCGRPTRRESDASKGSGQVERGPHWGRRCTVTARRRRHSAPIRHPRRS